MKRALIILLAWFRLSKWAICEASRGRNDFHDYPDSITPVPWHFHIHTCGRCSKHFGI